MQHFLEPVNLLQIIIVHSHLNKHFVFILLLKVLIIWNFKYSSLFSELKCYLWLEFITINIVPNQGRYSLTITYCKEKDPLTLFELVICLNWVIIFSTACLFLKLSKHQFTRISTLSELNFNTQEIFLLTSTELKSTSITNDVSTADSRLLLIGSPS